jgi:hypothetical protein
MRGDMALRVWISEATRDDIAEVSEEELDRRLDWAFQPALVQYYHKGTVWACGLIAGGPRPPREGAMLFLTPTKPGEPTVMMARMRAIATDTLHEHQER